MFVFTADCLQIIMDKLSKQNNTVVNNTTVSTLTATPTHITSTTVDTTSVTESTSIVSQHSVAKLTTENISMSCVHILCSIHVATYT